MPSKRRHQVKTTAVFDYCSTARGNSVSALWPHLHKSKRSKLVCAYSGVTVQQLFTLKLTEVQKSKQGHQCSS